MMHVGGHQQAEARMTVLGVVQVEVGPLGRPEELGVGDVPAPQLVRPAGEKLWGGVATVSELILSPNCENGGILNRSSAGFWT
jgi:hypothetical protein